MICNCLYRQNTHHDLVAIIFHYCYLLFHLIVIIDNNTLTVSERHENFTVCISRNIKLSCDRNFTFTSMMSTFGNEGMHG